MGCFSAVFRELHHVTRTAPDRPYCLPPGPFPQQAVLEARPTWLGLSCALRAAAAAGQVHVLQWGLRTSQGAALLAQQPRCGAACYVGSRVEMLAARTDLPISWFRL